MATQLRRMKKEKKISYALLEKKLTHAIQRNSSIKEKIGIAFSGGLDSGILGFMLSKKRKDCIFLTVGFPRSPDILRAEKWAKKWKMKWVKKELTQKEIEKNYARAGKILQTKDHLQQTLGALNLSIAQLAKKEKIKKLFVGSGADELFCGYALFDTCRNSSDACERLRKEKIEKIEEHDVKREVMCGKEYGIQLIAPYLDEDFAGEAMSFPAHENLKGKYGKLRKNVLRMLGEKMGVPLEIVQEKKKAMQYGSGTAKRLQTVH
ncbi:MAG: asparagine synthase-related protein [Candidatus Diapherotrites archaeon]